MVSVLLLQPPCTSGIYIMTNKSNGNRYIGYSEDIEVRYSENIRQLNAGTFGTPFEHLEEEFNFFRGI